MASNDQLPSVVHSGPSREEIFDALRLHREGRTVTFYFKGLEDYRNEFFVESLTVADQIGDSWKVVLRLMPNPRWLQRSDRRLTGVYNTRKREGEFVPIESV